MSDTTVDRPRVSILIPNFNNGRSSSRTGQRDFISDLLNSLDQTLRDDPTPFEIIVFDDGSTDDSIDTLRDWASNRTWPDGRPFCTLMEAPHCGILSVTANKLYRAARGDILVRLDGDIVCLTPRWVTQLCDIFDNGPPRLGIVGPKQLATGFQIHALGDWILHPKGYHHVGFALPRYAIRRSIEVDHVMGCFYCCKREVWDEVGEFDEKMMRGQTVDFGLRARMLGWSCWAVPDIEFIHAHTERHDRSTNADSRTGIDDSLEYFERKWGFSRIAPDLDEVRERYRGTPLVWNARWFDAKSFNDPLAVWARAWPAPAPGMSIENSDWSRFVKDKTYKERVMLRAKCIVDVIRQTGEVNQIVHLCSGSGLVGHLLAQKGFRYYGLDIHRSNVGFAQSVCRTQQYPQGASPTFDLLTDARRLPFDDDSVQLVAITDQMERHPNPVGLLKEVRRVLAPEGHLLIVSENRHDAELNLMQEERWYQMFDLINQVRSLRHMVVVSNTTSPTQRDHLMLAAQYLPQGISKTERDDRVENGGSQPVVAEPATAN